MQQQILYGLLLFVTLAGALALTFFVLKKIGVATRHRSIMLAVIVILFILYHLSGLSPGNR
jgi:hypothetical protein